MALNSNWKINIILITYLYFIMYFHIEREKYS